MKRCQQCGNHPEIKRNICYMRNFYLWERDLLECARRWTNWREIANSLGFTDAKIDTPWPHSDAGRLVSWRKI